MEDKSFAEAAQDQRRRLEDDIHAAINQRYTQIFGNTVASITADIPEKTLRETVTSLLLVLKIDARVSALTKRGTLTQAEYEEMCTFLHQLYRKATHSKNE